MNNKQKRKDSHNIVSIRRFVEHLITSLPHISDTDIDYEKVYNDALLREFVAESSEKYGWQMFRLLRAAELGDDYYLAAEAIRESTEILHSILGGRNLGVRITHFHLAAEMQCTISDSVENDAQLDIALEKLRGYTSAPLMADVDADTAYILWSHTGSWLGAMELAGLELPSSRAERRNEIARHRASHATVELLPDEVREQLSSEAFEMLERCCLLANEVGRMIYDFELPKGIEEAFYDSGFALRDPLRYVGLTMPTEKASPEIRAAALEREGEDDEDECFEL